MATPLLWPLWGLRRAVWWWLGNPENVILARDRFWDFLEAIILLSKGSVTLAPSDRGIGLCGIRDISKLKMYLLLVLLRHGVPLCNSRVMGGTSLCVVKRTLDSLAHPDLLNAWRCCTFPLRSMVGFAISWSCLCSTNCYVRVKTTHSAIQSRWPRRLRWLTSV